MGDANERPMTGGAMFVAGMIVGAVAMTILLLFLLPLERHDGP